MSTEKKRITTPGLEHFIVPHIKTTKVKLGVGAYGSVEEVEIPGARVAAKKLHSQLINLGSPEQVRKWALDFMEECKLMSQLHHPHIVQFLGVAYLPGSPIPVLLMEKLQTSLDNLLETSPNIPLDVKMHLLTGTARGIVYLHSHSPPIAHRDLTARNILIDSGLTAKIADLGVARIVNIQPGQLAATMTAGPGNNLYMPPETVQEEGVTRYNTAIDIFSFGVVSLFTLTQTFPKDLKPATFRDPITRQLSARSEVERREDYIKLLTIVFGNSHPLVKLTLDCLEYDPEDRPSAVEMLGRLEEVGRTVPQNCTETKLELIQQISEKNDEIRRVSQELGQKQADLAKIHDLRFAIDQLREAYDKLQAEKQEQSQMIREMISFQQQQVQVQVREVERLSGQLTSLELEPQKEMVVCQNEPPMEDSRAANVSFRSRGASFEQASVRSDRPLASRNSAGSVYPTTSITSASLPTSVTSTTFVTPSDASQGDVLLSTSSEFIGSDNKDLYYNADLQKSLFDAVKRGKLAEVKEIHSHGGSLTSTDSDGWTPLHHATRLQKKEIVQYIVDNVPTSALDVADEERLQTALHKAAWYGYNDICGMLVRAGASVNRKDYQGSTPYDKAVQSGDMELITFLRNCLMGTPVIEGGVVQLNNLK